MDRTSLMNAAYLVASIFFILGLKGLTHPRTAVRGNLMGAAGMLIAAVSTFLDPRLAAMSPQNYQFISAGLGIGAVVGLGLAVKIQMTAMPQLVAIFNGFGGIASTLVAGAELYEVTHKHGGPETQQMVATVFSGIIGTVTLTGSLIAFGKLQEIKAIDRLTGGKGVQATNALLAVACISVGGYATASPGDALQFYWIMVGLAAVLGITLTIPVGGADMPVVIALLNSYSGLAASATGFVLGNNVLIIAGSLVGASGIILTQIMCKAMNRSLAAVLFGTGTGGGAKGKSGDEVYAGKVKSTSPEEVAMLFDTAQRVVVVPGYGLAVAQAQHVVRDLARLLEERGITVEFGIHPVAGRMPGHMNVLMAEADISYDALKEMDEINPTFETVDVALVIGANDVVNPVARTDPNSPIAGMPILDVDKARTVVVVKRSLSPGFAGIPNPLFAADNCLMLFGDGKKALIELNAALKDSR